MNEVVEQTQTSAQHVIRKNYYVPMARTIERWPELAHHLKAVRQELEGVLSESRAAWEAQLAANERGGF